MSKEEFNIRLKTLISDYQLEREAVDAFIKYWPKAEEYPQDMWAV